MKEAGVEDTELEWRKTGEDSLLRTVVFEVQEAQFQAPDGRGGRFFLLDAPDWCVVIPENEGNFVMVRQWRHGANSLSMEFPGGVMDEGEEPEEAARRELLEETGFRAGEMVSLGSMNPNPALFKNRVHFFLARHLEATNRRALDDDEYINVRQVPKEQVLAGMGSGEYCHSIMAACLGIYLAKGF